MIRCPKCTTLVVRDTTRCTCGHVFSGSEPDAAPTAQDVQRWDAARPSAALPLTPQGLLIRIIVVGLVFGLSVVLAPQFMPRDMARSIMPLFTFPILFGLLWLLFSATVVATFLMREGSRISLLACIGYGFLLAAASTAFIWPSVLPGGPYGPGP